MTGAQPDRLSHALSYAKGLSEQRHAKALADAKPPSNTGGFSVRFSAEEYAHIVSMVDYLRKRGFVATKSMAIRAAVNAACLDQSLEEGCQTVVENYKRRRNG